MKRFLTSELKVWHLLVAVALLAIASGGVVIARMPGPMDHQEKKVASFTPAGAFPAGSFRMAASSSSERLTILAADGEVAVAHVNFIVGSGHTEDIAAFFNAAAYKNPNGYCYVNFELDRIGSTPINPGELWVVDGYVYKGGYPTISAQAFKTSVRAGHHTLYVTMHATGGDCTVEDRSLILTGNLR